MKKQTTLTLDPEVIKKFETQFPKHSLSSVVNIYLESLVSKEPNLILANETTIAQPSAITQAGTADFDTDFSNFYSKWLRWQGTQSEVDKGVYMIARNKLMEKYNISLADLMKKVNGEAPRVSAKSSNVEGMTRERKMKIDIFKYKKIFDNAVEMESEYEMVRAKERKDKIIETYQLNEDEFDKLAKEAVE